jgi:glycerol-3-phosphate acyltransferase PlsX
MGSDRAPKPEIEGAILAARQHHVHVLLVGKEEVLSQELAHHRQAARLPIEIVHASEAITMEDKAAQALRAKRDSSMRVGLRLVREGHGQDHPGHAARSGPPRAGSRFPYRCWHRRHPG